MNNLWGAHPNIVYFPIFYLEQLRQPNYQDYKKKYRISFLSNVSRFHRIYFYYTVKNSITNDDCFSIADFSSEEYHFYKNDMEDMLGYYEGDIERTIPFITNNANAYNNSIGKTSFIDFTNKHIAYASYVNVVGESDITAGKVFLTEKTWKAVRSGCIPVFFNPEYNIILKQVGFNFDNEINTIKSNYLDKINHLDNFMSSHSLDDVKKLHTSQRNAIKSNVDYFYSKDLKKLFNDHLRDKLNI